MGSDSATPLLECQRVRSGELACRQSESGVAASFAEAHCALPPHSKVPSLVTPLAKWTLGGIVQGWKGASARAINLRLGRTGRLWQPEPYDHVVRSEEQLAHYRRYIAENPIKARLREGEYALSKQPAK